MQSTDVLPPEWFVPLFAAGWFAVCALLAHLSGWRTLLARYGLTPPIEGERFRFASGALGAIPAFRVNYSNVLFITVGREGLALSLLLPFRFMAPQLNLPWSAVERVEVKKGFLITRTVVSFKGSAIELHLHGKAGRKVQEAFAAQRAGGR